MRYVTPAGGIVISDEPICGCGLFCAEHRRHVLELERARREAAEARVAELEGRIAELAAARSGA